VNRALAFLVAVAACDSPAAPMDAVVDAILECETCVAPSAAGVVIGLPTAELSGLAASRRLDGILWTLADAGGTPTIYALDTSAAPRGSLRLAAATNVDWEDIAVAPCASTSCIYVADTGDNDLIRETIAIYEVVEPPIVPSGASDVAWQRYDVRYPDGPHDMEALFVDPRDGVSYGITKVTTGLASVYALPRTSGAISLARVVAMLDISDGDDRRITAADLHVDACGARLLVRTHDRLLELRGAATISVIELLRTTPMVLPVATEPQGESVAVSPSGDSLYTISEGDDPTLWRSSCAR